MTDRTEFDIAVVQTERRGSWELAARNGKVGVYTDVVRVAVAKDRKRAITALAAEHPGVDGDSVEQKLLAAAALDRKARGHRRRRAPSGDGDLLSCTDLANARRLVQLHGADLRYCAALGGWFCWTGTHWVRDDIDAVAALAKEVSRVVLREAADQDDSEQAKRLAQHAVTSASEPSIRRLLKLAQSEPGIAVRPSDFNADPWVLCCLNGVIDLHDGTLREHRREDLISQLAPVNYDPSAISERWQTFLREATGRDVELEKYLQKAAGYTLVGLSVEEILLLCFGPEASGKSTYLESLRATLGTYAKTCDGESLSNNRSRGGGVREDIARLHGARLVVTVELDEGVRLAEALLKSIVSGDSLVARFLFKDSFEFVPGFTLWVSANHRPCVSDKDGAMWRRLRLAPFAHTVPPERRDPTLKAELTDPTRSGAAILAWCVQGCLAWQREGLAAPSCVTEATDGYRASQDPLAGFLRDVCVLTPAAWTSASDLRNAYDEWSRGERETVGAREFADRLRDAGCEQKWRRTGPGGSPKRGWQGVGLRTSVDEVSQ